MLSFSILIARLGALAQGSHWNPTECSTELEKRREKKKENIQGPAI